MNKKNVRIPVLVPDDVGPGEVFYVELAPSAVTVLQTSGDFYSNFLDYHKLEHHKLDSCNICGSFEGFEINPQDIVCDWKMWTPFPWYRPVRCAGCDAIYSINQPPKELLNFLYTYCYPNLPNETPRFFTAFNHYSKNIDKNVVDLGGGSGDLRRFCKGEYINIDISASSDISLNIDDDIDKEQIEELLSPYSPEMVVCCDLIEHVLKPKNVFKIAAACLTSGGEFYLNVGQMHDKNSISSFHPPHLTSFSHKTIKLLCSQFNFSIIEKNKSSYILRKE